MPGALSRVIRVLIHFHADDEHRAPPRLPRRRAGAARGPRRGAVRESAGGPRVLRARPAHPRLPGGRRLRAARGRRAAGLQRVAVPAAARRSSRRSTARPAAASTATRTRRTPRCAARSATATASRRRGSRSATARATSCWPPARRCSSRAPRSSTRGRRSRSTRTSRPPPGATAITRAARRPRPSTTSTRWPREITAATRLVIVCNPNNPTSTALPARRDRGLRRARAAPRLRDPRRGLLRVQHARRPRRVGRPARAPPEPRAAADVLEGLRALRPARRLRAVRLGGVRHRGRPGAPAVLLQRRRAGRGDRGAAPPGRGRRAASSARSWRALELEDGLRELGIEPAESQANFCWFELPVPDGEDPPSARPASSRGLARARRARARRHRARPRGRAARDLRHARARTRASCASWARCSDASPARRSTVDVTGERPPAAAGHARAVVARSVSGMAARPDSAFAPGLRRAVAVRLRLSLRLAI